MNGPVTFEELASLMKERAGVSVDPQEMADRPDATFAEYELDSLGVIGIVAELQKRYDRPLTEAAEVCKTPRDFLDNVNAQLTAGV